MPIAVICGKWALWVVNRLMREDVLAGRNHLADGGARAFLRVFQNEEGDLLYLDPGATKLRMLVRSSREDFLKQRPRRSGDGSPKDIANVVAGLPAK